MVNAFNAQNITLHLDVAAAPVSFIRNNQNVTHVNHVNTSPGTDFEHLALLWVDFEAIKTANFAPERCNVFHYSLWVHNLFPGDGGSSGVSQGVFTDDFLVSLGSPNDPFWAQFNRQVLEAATFMHELGHTLDLRHGGAFDFPVFKPNYRSVMCYRYQMTGIDVTCDAAGDGIIDFSNEVLPDLHEPALQEADGLGGVGICAGQPIDWNKNCVTDPQPIPQDITCHPLNLFQCGQPHGVCQDPNPSLCDKVCCAVLSGFNDWAAIRLDFQNSSNRVAPPDPFPAILECNPPGGGSVGLSPLQCFGTQN